MPYHRVRIGEGTSPARRSMQGMWLGIGLTAILAGYPLGLVLVAMGAPDWWTPVYGILLLVALGAAFGFASWTSRRKRGAR